MPVLERISIGAGSLSRLHAAGAEGLHGEGARPHVAVALYEREDGVLRLRENLPSCE
jgi:hypothetical protein